MPGGMWGRPPREHVGGLGREQKVAENEYYENQGAQPRAGGHGGCPPREHLWAGGWETYLSNIYVIFETTTGKATSEIKQPNPTGK